MLAVTAFVSSDIPRMSDGTRKNSITFGVKLTKLFSKKLWKSVVISVTGGQQM